MKYEWDENKKALEVSVVAARAEELAYEMPDYIDFTGAKPLNELLNELGIDYDASPEQAQKTSYYKPIKKQVNMRLDMDVVDTIKLMADQQGIGYQTLINSMLRSLVIERQTKKA